jgi:hypothetical protein
VLVLDFRRFWELVFQGDVLSLRFWVFYGIRASGWDFRESERRNEGRYIVLCMVDVGGRWCANLLLTVVKN